MWKVNMRIILTGFLCLTGFLTSLSSMAMPGRDYKCYVTAQDGSHSIRLQYAMDAVDARNKLYGTTYIKNNKKFKIYIVNECTKIDKNFINIDARQLGHQYPL